ncbi:MAG: hypothetical protein JWO38_7854 [Gemmataceae bacterium]|nr:hypothetical protein [Gemmataceae bacterium]
MIQMKRGRDRWSAAGAVTAAGLVAVVVLFRPGGGAGAAEKPAAGGPAADLAMVPADAAGFVHVRLADVWKNDLFAGLRKTWEKAGEKAIAALDKQFVPAPSSVDRATAFVVLDPETKEPRPFGVLRFSAPFDAAEVAMLYLPEGKVRKVGGKAVYTSRKLPGVAVHFPDDRHILVGPDKGMDAYLSTPVAKTGPLSEALKLAASGRPVVAAVNIAALPIPPNALDGLPAEIRPLLKADLVVLSLDLGADAKLDLKAGYRDAAAAADAETAVKALIALGRKEIAKTKKELEDKLYDPKIQTPRSPEDLPEAVATVFGIGALAQADELLGNPDLIRRQGKDLAFSAAIPKEIIAVVGGYGAVGVGLLLPAVQKVRLAAARTQSMNNLKQIGLAIHNYHDANGVFPSDITDKNGKPILSWRVAILPYIEQDNVYRLFKMDEPWDGPNNKSLSQLRIKTYISPNAPEMVSKDGYGLTSYKGVSGPGAAFEPGKKLRIADFTDGLSNTIMVVEAGDPIPWAKPGDLPFDPKKPLPKLTAPGLGDLFLALMADGSVRAVDTKKVSEKTLKAAFTRNGGEVLGEDW